MWQGLWKTRLGLFVLMENDTDGYLLDEKGQKICLYHYLNGNCIGGGSQAYNLGLKSKKRGEEEKGWPQIVVNQ